MTDPRPMAAVTAPKRASRHWKAATITWADLLAWCEAPGTKKEAGNYLLGTLKETTETHPRSAGDTRQDESCTALHRKAAALVSRSAVTLDADSPAPDFIDRVRASGVRVLAHTTFSSAPDGKRYRLVVPTDRDMAPDEYEAVARSLVAEWGTESFDSSTCEPVRYMFKPATAEPGWFWYEDMAGDVLDVDLQLRAAKFTEDLSDLPAPRPSRTKRDPFELEGVVGAFNRVYEDLGELVEAYELPYEHAGADRWHLVGARSMAGMGPVHDAPGLFYSHHSGDPAGGQTCSAFDLVRLHRFGELDETCSPQMPINRRPSHSAMLELASTDPRVTAELVGLAADDFEVETEDGQPAPDAWRLDLKLSPRTGKMIDTIGNWDLIAANDPAFTGLRYNELTLSVETVSAPPWRPLEPRGATFTGVDRSSLCLYLERTYGIRPSRGYVDELVDTLAHERAYNPLREYLDGLEWDGVPRLETCLPGVAVTDYSRLVARKCLVAAVARVFQPGVKFDHALILYGTEGLGKSWWIDRMSLGYSATLGRISDKDTLITMQRSWIMTADEGHSLKKADQDAQKEFLTRTEDVFRMPYDREAMVHPRHCVIWGTTNDEVFLRRQEGNRRYLIVTCAERADFDRYTDEYVAQVWAEAVALHRAGEPLYLSSVESEMVGDVREAFVEEDALGGLLAGWLDEPVPGDYEDQPPEARAEWRRDNALGLVPAGTEELERVCSLQIWVECLGKRLGDHRRTDLLEITAAMKRVPGWTLVPGRTHIPGYGPQSVFIRDTLI